MTDLLMRRTAHISPCGLYRYRLTRAWDDSKPALPFVMLNPSTADADVGDPTIRRCMAFARRENAGGIVEHGSLPAFAGVLITWRAFRVHGERDA